MNARTNLTSIHAFYWPYKVLAHQQVENTKEKILNLYFKYQLEFCLAKCKRSYLILSLSLKGGIITLAFLTFALNISSIKL